MKLTILGGGGFRVPLVYQAATSANCPVLIDELAFYDTSAQRMAAIKAVITGLGHPTRTRLTFSSDLADAVRDADFIFCAIRVGGLKGRVSDEQIALSLDVLGQETTGPGGLAYALRTIPVMRKIAQTVRDLAPNAYFINFTNPAGIVTESLHPILGEKVIGICDTPIGLLRRIQRLTGICATNFDYVGLNHLGWLRSVEGPAGDVLPGVLADDSKLAQLEEARLVGFDWVRQLGALPNEYLYYYYYNREAVARIKSGHTRGELVRDQQEDFYAAALAYPEMAADAWQTATKARESTYMAEARPVGKEEDREPQDLGGGYQQVAMDIMAALATNVETTLILNVANRREDGSRVVSALPDESVVEVPCTVDAGGVHALNIAPVIGHQAGLLASVKTVEQLTIEAAISGRAELAWRAMALHPLVDSVDIGRELLTGYRAAHPELNYLR